MPCRPARPWLVVVPILLALGALPTAPRASRAQPDVLQGFDEYVSRAVERWKVPGLAVAIVKDGEVVFEKGYGVRRLGASDPVTGRTLFAVGSTTKAMTAAALGMLADEGRLAWDDPVTKHLPWFTLHDPYATRETTVRDLLTHRAGLGNADFLWYEQDVPTREIVERLRHLEPETSMRSHFTYQNIMYAAAGEVVSAVSGVPWAEFIRSRIFEPVGMDGSIPTAATLDRQPDVASPHSEIDGTVEVIRNASVDNVAAAGAVWSSVHDMARWMRVLLDEGRAGGSDGRQLLQEGTVAELFTPQTIVGADAFYPTRRLTKPHWTTYGLGWFQHDYAGHQLDFHTGSIDGMVAIVGLLRDEELGVCVLANLDHAEVRHALMYTVLDRYLGRPTRDWSAELGDLYRELAAESADARKKTEAERVGGTTPSQPLERYAGTYRDPLYGTVTIDLTEGRLRARYGHGFVGPLEHWHYDTFRATWEARWRGTALLTFRSDPRGRIAGLETNGRAFVRVEEGEASRPE